MAIYEPFTRVGLGGSMASYGMFSTRLPAVADWLRWPSRTEVVLLHAEVPVRLTSAWGALIAPHQMLGTWSLGTAWTEDDPSSANVMTVSRFVTLTGFAGGLYREVIGVREDGVDLAEVAIDDVPLAAGSWNWTPSTGALTVQASSGAPSDHAMLAIVRFRFANRPIVLNTAPSDPDTGQYYYPWITGQAPAIRRSREDLLSGAVSTPSGSISLLNQAGWFFYLAATDGPYIWKNAAMKLFAGGAYNGIDFDLDDFVPIEAMLAEDVAVDETVCTFALQLPTRLTRQELPITPFFEGDYPNLGDGVRGTKKWIGYGRATITPDLTDALPAIDIASSSIANPSVVATDEPHRLVTGNTAVIAGHTSATPDINGQHVVTVISPTTFSIPVNVTDGGVDGTVTRVLSIYTVADAAYQTLTAVHNVWAVNKSTKVRMLLTLTTDYTVDLTACTVTIVNATYAHATFELAVDVTGIDLQTFSAITRDILQRRLDVATADIDTAAFDQAALDAPDELAFWIKSPRSISSLIATGEPSLPSLGRSVGGTVQQTTEGKWTCRIWTDTARGDEVLLERSDYVQFTPQPQLKAIYSTVRVYYNFDHSKQEWSVVEDSDPTVTQETRAQDPPLDVYTYHRTELAAETLLALYLAIATQPPVNAVFEERGCRLIQHRAGDRFLQTFAPAPTITRGYVRQLFELQDMEVSFAPKLTVRGVARMVPSGVTPAGDPVLTYSGTTTGAQNMDETPLLPLSAGSWTLSVNRLSTYRVYGSGPGGQGSPRVVTTNAGGQGGGGGGLDETGVTLQLQPGVAYEVVAPVGGGGWRDPIGDGPSGIGPADAESTSFGRVDTAPVLELGGGKGGNTVGTAGQGGLAIVHSGSGVDGGDGGAAAASAAAPGSDGDGTGVPGGGGGAGYGTRVVGAPPSGVPSDGGAGGNSGQPGNGPTGSVNDEDLDIGGDGGRGGGVTFAGVSGTFGGGGGGQGGLVGVDITSGPAPVGEAGVIVIELVSVP